MQEEIKELIKLNNQELLSVIKNYLLVYTNSLLKENNSNNRKILMSKLKEYINTIKEENSYYKYLLNNLSKIRNTEALDNLLYKMDYLNEITFSYYDKLLRDYEENIPLQRDFKCPSKDFSTINDREDLKEEAISLTISFYDLLKYFSKEDAMHYLVPRSKFISDANDFYGCYLIEDGNILKDIKLCLPPIKDQKSLEKCVYLYEIAILMYYHLHSDVPKADFRYLAMHEVNKFKERKLKKF